MIIDYDKNPSLTPEEQIKSLRDSVQMALNETQSLLESGITSDGATGYVENTYIPSGGVTSYNELTDKPTINGVVLEGDITVSGDKTFVYEQATPSDTWTITHGLDKYPSITVIDSAGTEVIGEYTMLNNNDVILEFSGAFAGKAFFN